MYSRPGTLAPGLSGMPDPEEKPCGHEAAGDHTEVELDHTKTSTGQIARVRTLVSDVGGVLLRTDDGAFGVRLAEFIGLPVEDVAAAVEKSGVYEHRDIGNMSLPEITQTIRDAMNVPGLAQTQVTVAWNAVLGHPDPVLAPLAARLSHESRLVLATNTNEIHWPIVLDRLEAAGISRSTPSMPSYLHRVAKPDSRYFRRLVDMFLEPGESALFVDDKPDNVAAAREVGLHAYLHEDVAATAAAIVESLGLERAWLGRDRGASWSASRFVSTPRVPKAGPENGTFAHDQLYQAWLPAREGPFQQAG